jgi:hypothetical protein
MATNRHDPEKVLAMQAPIINGGMPQIVKGKQSSRPVAGRASFKSF